MTTMSIHVEDAFAQALRDFAMKSGSSVNQAVKSILAPVLGFADTGSPVQDPYSDVIGGLSHEDAEEMMRTVSAQRVIDEEMWK